MLFGKKTAFIKNRFFFIFINGILNALFCTAGSSSRDTATLMSLKCHINAGMLASWSPGQFHGRRRRRRLLPVTVLEEMRLSCDLRESETELHLRGNRAG